MSENRRKQCIRCGSSPASEPGISLHHFPKPGIKNSLRCELWAQYCFPHESWASIEFQKKLSSQHMLCSKHFTETCFVNHKLLRTAVPSKDSDEVPTAGPSGIWKPLLENLNLTNITHNATNDDTQPSKASSIVTKSINKPISQPLEKQKTKRTSRGYKYYSSTDMEGTMEAVLNANFSITEAAKMYNVPPRQTLTAKLRSLRRDSVQSAVKPQVQDKQYFFVEEVKKILSFTTAVPFKTKVSRYYCAFCNKNIDSFDHPSELRTHTSLHEDEMVYEMDRILRPQYRNEILKVDIRDFQCKDCAEPIQSWNDMFIHLSEVHEIELDEVHNRLIPYNLTSNSLVNCALCGAEFPHFKYLDAHMNTHYCNYTCSECGETFLTEIRLKRHKVIHNTSKYPCKHCGKVFSFEKYKKNHEAMVHHGEYKMFRCIDCGEQFLKQYERHLHIVEQHPFRVRISTCEVCGKNFDWRPYYLAHLRKAHTICRYCGKRFETKYEVKTHEMRHTGDGRFVCMFCEKNFVTSIELTRHYDERHF